MSSLNEREIIKNPFNRIASNRNRALKLYLLNKDPHCYWCGRKTKDYGILPIGTKNPNDMATIDHKVSRFFRKKGEEVEKVLACEECNNKRSLEENDLYGPKSL